MPKASGKLVQAHHGGYSTPYPASGKMIEKAKEIVLKIDSMVGKTLYLRIDAIMLHDELVVTEVEGIEPYLELGNQVKSSDIINNFVRKILEKIERKN